MSDTADSNAADIVVLPSAAERDPYLSGRQRVTDLLIGYSLIDSFFKFTSEGKPYPFPEPDELLPHNTFRRTEYGQQNPVLMAMVDGQLPRPLNRHFRLRSSNKVRWRNIQRLAPDLDLSDFKASQCQMNDADFDSLLTRLLPLDYALMAERLPDAKKKAPAPLELTHMHVKVERLTDNAIKDLGKQLGYIERRLFERGEDYVEALEAKFFEYYGFTSRASGRKSAAAMAAQLLGNHNNRFCVFVAGQEDCRLTVLDEGETITQYLLVRLSGNELDAFKARTARLNVEDPSVYALNGIDSGPQIVLFRLLLERTDAARPNDRRRPDRDLLQPWLRVAEQAILPQPGQSAPIIPFSWAGTGD